jgi:hypothetical protein
MQSKLNILLKKQTYEEYTDIFSRTLRFKLPVSELYTYVE